MLTRDKTERLGFRVFSIYDLLDHEQHRCRMREILAFGLDHWWIRSRWTGGTFFCLPLSQLDQLMLLSALAEQIPDHAEIFATSPHLTLRALSLLLSREIKSFSLGYQTNNRRTASSKIAPGT